MIISCVITLTLRFAIVALPAIGVFYFESLSGRVVFAALWLSWGLLIAKKEVGTSTVVGTMHVQLPIILIELFSLRSAWIAIPLYIYAGLALVTVWRHYRFQFVRNELLREMTEEVTTRRQS